MPYPPLKKVRIILEVEGSPECVSDFEEWAIVTEEFLTRFGVAVHVSDIQLIKEDVNA